MIDSSDKSLEQNSTRIDTSTFQNDLSQTHLSSREITCRDTDMDLNSSPLVKRNSHTPAHILSPPENTLQGTHQSEKIPDPSSPNLNPLRRSSRLPKRIEPRCAWQTKPPILYVGGNTSIPQS